MSDEQVNEEQAQREEILLQLVKAKQLERSAAGVARQVLARGEKSLSERQQWVFRSQVSEKYIDRICELCEQVIHLSEVTGSWGNGGYCAVCARILGKDGSGSVEGVSH